MPMRKLQDALIEEMQDLLHAERQIANALPMMADRTTDTQLKEAFQKHKQQTDEQIQRLERAFQAIGEQPKAKRCEGIEGILEESEDLLSDDLDPDVMNAILIASAQKVEHYEIASYGTVSSWAEILEHKEAADLLRQTLEEEKETDQSLTKLAEASVNRQARH